MNLKGKTILITGGATGIGGAFARRFVQAGSRVVVCGRRKAVLDQFKQEIPAIDVRVCDVARENERIELAQWIGKELPALSMLINNAGIQRHINLKQTEAWSATREELAVNLEAPIHLTSLLLDRLLKADEPAVVNVTSGLAFSPLAGVPVYCATKAALRSFTLSLRHQLADTPVKVIEVIPPAVNTDLGGPGLHTFGAPLDEFADSVFTRLAAGEVEIAYGFAEQARNASRQELTQIFERMNAPRR